MFAQPAAATLNHLLAQNNWSETRLARFAGKTVRFEIAPFCFAYTIQADGTLRGVASAVTADAICVIAPSLLPRLALHDEKAYRDVSADGDAALLAEIFFLARNLQWDAAKDLSRLTGDNIARRIVQTVKNKRQQLHEMAENFSKAAAEYCTEEHPLLARPQQVAEFILQVDTLRDDVARLEQRIKQMSATRGH